jgi:hypothetical protein
MHLGRTSYTGKPAISRDVMSSRAAMERGGRWLSR